MYDFLASEITLLYRIKKPVTGGILKIRISHFIFTRDDSAKYVNPSVRRSASLVAETIR